MFDAQSLSRLIDDRAVTLGVVGLGYVGLPVACTFAHAGFQVIGIDVDSDRVDLIRAGKSPIEGDEPGLEDMLTKVITTGRLRTTTDYSTLADAKIVTINVQTPVGADHAPDLRALRSACDSLGEVMKPGTLVIVESTVPPGTSEGVVVSWLEAASSLRHGVDFMVGACPERVMPGRLLQNIRSVARVAGAPTHETAETMRKLYRTVVEAEIDCVNTTTAELVKVVENTYRDVQIAFANEVALLCADLGEDVWKVRELVNKVPYRDMHLPGGGVGGHCIPKDPWLLVAATDRPLHLVSAARKVNDSMPLMVADLVTRAASAISRQSDGFTQPRVLVLGYAYLPNSDDARNSPSASLVESLRSNGLEVLVHDPHVESCRGDLDSMAARCDIAILMVPHDEYANLDLPCRVFLDARLLSQAKSLIKMMEDENNA